MGLIKKKRSDVALNCSTLASGVLPMEFSALVIVELLPFTKHLKKDEDATSFQRLLGILTDIQNKTRKHEYSKDSLVRWVLSQYLEPLTIDDLKDIIKESIYLQFPTSLSGTMVFSSVSQHPPKLRTDYGEEEFIIPEQEGKLESSKSVKDDTEASQNRTVINQQASSLTEDKRLADQEIMSDSGQLSNNLAELLLSSLLSSMPSRANAKHTWQWLLSNGEYERIKNFVSNNHIPTPAKLGQSFASLIRLYVGEFYKREWDGNNNPFKSLVGSVNSDFGRFDLIREKSKLTAYKKINDTHLQTLFVDGGLPVHYICTKLENNNKNLFIESLSYLFETEDDGLIAEGEVKFEKSIGSTALRESYHQGLGHSIFDYINAVRDQKPTWNDSDNGNQEFSEFVEKIKAARDTQDDRRKFKMQYSLWTNYNNDRFSEFCLTPILRFKPVDTSGSRHYAISTKKLLDWGVRLDSSQFSLIIQNQSILFSWCIAGDYVSRGLLSSIELDSVGSEGLTPEVLSAPAIRFVCTQENIDIELPQNSVIQPLHDGLVQLFTNDIPSMALWRSNKGNQAFKWSGIIYDKSRYSTDSQYPSLEINNSFGWVTFEDQVVLRDEKKGKVLAIHNRKDSLFATVAQQSIHPIVRNGFIVPSCISENTLSCTIGNKSRPVFIVRPKGIRFIVGNSDSDESYKQDIIDDAFSISYQSITGLETNSNASWCDYNPTEELAPGLYAFLIAFRSLSTTVICRVLPENATIDTYFASTPQKISFKNIDSVESFDGLRVKKDTNCTTFFINNQDKDTFRFSVGGIILETYSPKPQIHAFLNGIETKDLLLPYAEDIRISVISSNGCSSYYLSENERVFKRLFSALTSTVTGGNCNSCQPIMLESVDSNIANSDCRIRIYTREIDTGELAGDFYLLNLTNNALTPITTSDILNDARVISREKGDGLLFQSLKDSAQVTTYFAPKYISKRSTKPDSKSKVSARRQRLNRYVDEQYWLKDHSYEHFEIACEHKLFFAVFDTLLCLMWDARNHSFYPTTGAKFKKRLSAFLAGYINYCKKLEGEVKINGLLRFAKEFQFEWTVLNKESSSFDLATLKIFKKLTVR